MNNLIKFLEPIIIDVSESQDIPFYFCSTKWYLSDIRLMYLDFKKKLSPVVFLYLKKKKKNWWVRNAQDRFLMALL